MLAPQPHGSGGGGVGVHSTQIDELTWFESRPLFGKRVLVTRAREPV